ncbi:MAG: OmpA family protein [Formivibrio sp.]|nr:OmpA family protein [Formivibrio sp.]
MSKKLLISFIVSAVFAGVSTVSYAGIEAYVQGATAEPVWKNSFGECWHTGTWTPEAATVEGCDGYVKPVPPAPVAATPEPAPMPEPAKTEPPPPPKVFTLKADVLFDFDKAVLKPDGKKALDSLYDEVKKDDPQIGFAKVTGYADRIGTEKYNLKLSKARADTVADYLTAKGTQENKIQTEGLGKANPVTGNTCNKVHPRKKLIECLAPDRRVEIEIQGQK